MGRQKKKHYVHPSSFKNDGVYGHFKAIGGRQRRMIGFCSPELGKK
ncbi:MAG TPA: hypothetical protein VII95_13620 [Terriglobales bacterium]